MKKHTGAIILAVLMCLTCLLYLAPKPQPKADTTHDDQVHLRLDPSTKRYAQTSTKFNQAQLDLQLAQHNYQTYVDMNNQLGTKDKVKNEFNPETTLSKAEVTKGLNQAMENVNKQQQAYKKAKDAYTKATKDYDLNHDKSFNAKVGLD